jgi:hypothetical protein
MLCIGELEPFLRKISNTGFCFLNEKPLLGMLKSHPLEDWGQFG